MTCGADPKWNGIRAGEWLNNDERIKFYWCTLAYNNSKIAHFASIVSMVAFYLLHIFSEHIIAGFCAKDDVLGQNILRI